MAKYYMKHKQPKLKKKTIKYLKKRQGLNEHLSKDKLKWKSITQVMDSLYIDFHYSKELKAVFLDSPDWKLIRTRLFTVFRMVCLCCGRTGQLHVDHIVAVTKDPTKCLDINNLQPLCLSCNYDKSNTDYTDYRSKDKIERVKKLNNGLINNWIKYFPRKCKKEF